MKKEYKLKTCPKCGSNHIVINTINDKIIWNCECGWSGFNPLDKVVTKKEYLAYADSLKE